MGSSSNKDSTRNGEGPTFERRRSDRTRDDVDWETKVLGRLNGSLHRVPEKDPAGQPDAGWESSVVDELRKKIEKGAE